jgi:polyisoprenoid-binding protein YceI
MTDFSSTGPASSNLIRTVDGVELPAAGLWNIPSGWASIELSVPKVFGRALRTRMRLKQGMIAIADDPTHSTANLSLDATSLRTGHPARDRYLHDKVLNSDRYSTIPVRIATIEHCSGPHWKADGWITIGGVSTAMELDLTYEGSYRAGSIATFGAHGNIPLRGILAGRNELRSRLLAGRYIRISIEVHAEPVRATAILPTRAERPRIREDLATAI